MKTPTLLFRGVNRCQLIGSSRIGMATPLTKVSNMQPGVAPGIFRRGADSSDEGAKIWFSGYYKCQKSPKKSLFTFRRGASMLRRGATAPSLPLAPYCMQHQCIMLSCTLTCHCASIFSNSCGIEPEIILNLFSNVKGLTLSEKQRNILIDV